MSTTSYDYAIVGAGAAGLQLALHIASEPALNSRKILILEKDPKESNDRTWSFWEKGESLWDEIATKKWANAAFYSSNHRHAIPFGEYRYKTIRSSDFYRYAKEQIHLSQQFTWVTDDICDINEHTIVGVKETYFADHIFDSRIPKAFDEKKDQHVSLVQHFLGWFIETPEPAFNDDEITIMDYRIKWKDQTSFNYVLPFSPNSALIEFTLFNESLLEEKEYEEILSQYITKTLGIKDFKIVEREIGQIPMSSYPFKKHHSKHCTKIGTAGGWVRPSSGYSFKNAGRYSNMIVRNLVKGKTPSRGVASNRYRFYDRVFLSVLKQRNDLGEEIFETLYTKQPVESLFRFMDEKSTFWEDFKIMFSLDKPIFRKALLQSLRS